MAIIAVLFSIVSLFVVGAFSEDDHNILTHLKTEIDECMKEVQVDKALVVSLLKEKVYTEDKNLKCFVHCLHVKLNFVNEEGVANVDEMKKMILSMAKDKDTATETIEKCSKINEGDKCETAFAMCKCLREI
ncbi:hypothetical protein FQR65_LT09969 [Abscondita terminalis]|nr:hypothetical protein FQR65_LT09969 [Abscondita terminalis]